MKNSDFNLPLGVNLKIEDVLWLKKKKFEIFHVTL